MFHRITCPTCQHKFSVPEAAMGQRQTCPNCQSLFQAGKSVAEAEVPMKLQPAPAPAGGAPINKTLLGETDAPQPPIKYNCPRCKKPLESPASEALTKKPCPACGGRLQVPAAPKPSAQLNINKTILATDEGAIQAGQPAPAAAPAPSAAATTTAPPARSPLASPLAIAGIAGVGLILLVLVACVATMYLTGGAERERIAKAQADYEKAQKELVELKRSIQESEALMAHKLKLEANSKKQWDDFMEKHKAKQRELDAERDRELALAKDQDARERLKEKRRQEQEALEREEKARLAKNAEKEREFQAEIAKLKAQVDAQSRQAQDRTVIVSQPPPVYYPPYHPRYYWGW